MQYEVNSARDYLNLLEEDWRKEKLLQIRSTILGCGPDLVEGIEYKMLSYGDGTRSIFHLNAQKNYVSLYVGDLQKVEKAADLLSGLDRGKGCIRIKQNVSLDDTGLSAFIVKVIDIWKKGGETEC